MLRERGRNAESLDHRGEADLRRRKRRRRQGWVMEHYCYCSRRKSSSVAKK